MSKLRNVLVLFCALPLGCTGTVPEEWSSVDCARRFECDRVRAEGVYRTIELCEEAQQRDFEQVELEAIEDAVARGTVVYDEDAMRECIADLDALRCDVNNRPPPESCELAVAGQVEPGGNCRFDIDCAGLAYCSDEFSCPGVCAEYAGLGESCAETKCERGLLCRDDVCVARAGVGGDCTTLACDWYLRCVVENEGTENERAVCRELADVEVGEGEECGFPETCEEGLACVSTAEGVRNTCLPTVASGAACYRGFPDPCPVGEYCAADVEGGDYEGTCTPVRKRLESCDRYNRCAAGLQCHDEVCKRPIEDGGICDESVEDLCLSGYCEDGLCTPEPDCLPPF